MKNFLLVSNISTIEKQFRIVLNQYTQVLSPSYKIGCQDSSYVLTTENPNELQTMKFGLTPHWSSKQMNILNARVEGDKNKDDDPYFDGAKAIIQSNAFKRPIRTQRCLVVADAFYAVNNQNKPFLVYLEDKVRPFAFAGLYDKWLNSETNKIHCGFSIITTTANELFMQMGVKRMPVILPIGRENDWLKLDYPLYKVMKILDCYPESEKMNAYPISDFVLNSDVNDSSLIKPIGEKLQQIIEPQFLPRRGWYTNKKVKDDNKDYFTPERLGKT